MSFVWSMNLTLSGGGDIWKSLSSEQTGPSTCLAWVFWWPSSLFPTCSGEMSKAFLEKNGPVGALSSDYPKEQRRNRRLLIKIVCPAGPQQIKEVDKSILLTRGSLKCHSRETVLRYYWHKKSHWRGLEGWHLDEPRESARPDKEEGTSGLRDESLRKNMLEI